MSGENRGGPPPTLSFVGAGRAGSALAVAAAESGYRVVSVAGRSREPAERLARLTGAGVAPTPAAAAASADITFLTVPDSAIVPVAATIAATGVALRGRALVHCAARFQPSVLAAARLTGAATGVLHPLQALAGGRSAALLRGSFFRVDAGGSLRRQLAALVAALGGRIIEVPADALAVYHAAAVLAGNAPLALLGRAQQLLEDTGVDPHAAREALAALLHGAASNAMSGAGAALTGPVVRGDAGTIAAHIEALASDPAALDLYVTLALETARLAGRDPAALGLTPEEIARGRGPVIQRVA